MLFSLALESPFVQVPDFEPPIWGLKQPVGHQLQFLIRRQAPVLATGIDEGGIRRMEKQDQGKKIKKCFENQGLTSPWLFDQRTRNIHPTVPVDENQKIWPACQLCDS
jgi:hypothetical protein